MQNEADSRELLHSGDTANIANIKAGELPDTSFLDNMSTIDGNKASINSYDEIKESLKNIGSAMLSTSRNISAVGYAFKGYDAAASNVFKSRKN